ncbi:arylsulfatase [Coraliomargarita sp. SDUM461004]|uniref:Arylsulfatase n=1 Tax=Thalassobacterium sedimentorum TaxID=3041258 RepID=A0ABU1AN80_9BACT|nr:arylsulfatase [Coraliomargarita sp. SDUM461004]MDQ8196199.1 arylsulfatase [Coraliomargarita sp. SDUM461004]
MICKKLFCLLGLSAAVLLTGELAAQTLAGSRPNIILVMTDDQGMGDLSCMGNEIVRTPHIDRFYQQSTRFTNFQVSPTCAPTRAAIMSGRFPFKVGVTHTILQRERMALDVYTLPQALKSAGYATGLFGKWHLGDEFEYRPQSRGFDEVLMHGAGGIGQTIYGDFVANQENPYFDNILLHNNTVVQTQGFCTDVFFDAAEGWIQQQHEAGQPYFAYLSLNAPHGPMYAPEEYKQHFLSEGYDEDTAARYGMIENIDDNFGQLMALLKKWKALDNTLIIFMTDNGMSMKTILRDGEKISPFNANMRGRKNSPNEGGTHVPAFWQWKGVLKRNVDIDALVAHIDLYKTLAELAGAQLPTDMQSLDGRSLLPLLEDPQANWADRELFFHCGRWKTGERDAYKYRNNAVRTERWRFVNNQQLYDIQQDPGETKDVSQQFPEVVSQLRKSYDQWWDSALPLMVNEGLPRIKGDHPLQQLYEAQQKNGEIVNWTPEQL